MAASIVTSGLSDSVWSIFLTLTRFTYGETGLHKAAVERSFNRWLESLIIIGVGEPGKPRIYNFLVHKLGPLPFQ
jgi:hypothetical protein